MTVARENANACSDGNRGLFGGGYTGSSSNVIDYVNIGTIGNTVDFGDLTRTHQPAGSTSDGCRGVWGGGLSPTSNIIDYVNIAITGNAADFGDLTSARYSSSATSGD